MKTFAKYNVFNDVTTYNTVRRWMSGLVVGQMVKTESTFLSIKMCCFFGDVFVLHVVSFGDTKIIIYTNPVTSPFYM